MPTLRFGLIAIMIAFQCAAPCQAQDGRQGARQLMFDKQGNPALFKTKPARELMSETEFENYSHALKDFDCERANRILNKAFVRQYPVFREARLGPHCPNASSCRYWDGYAGVKFDAYGYCTTMTGLKKAKDEIDRQKIPQTTFKMKPIWEEINVKKTEYDNPWIESRDHDLAGLIGLARAGHRPALVQLAERVRRGGVFNAGRDVEYYILKRACIIGKGCRELTRRLDALRAQINPQRLAEIDKKAQAKDRERPHLHKLLLGERL